MPFDLMRLRTVMAFVLVIKFLYSCWVLFNFLANVAIDLMPVCVLCVCDDSWLIHALFMAYPYSDVNPPAAARVPVDCWDRCGVAGEGADEHPKTEPEHAANGV